MRNLSLQFRIPQSLPAGRQAHSAQSISGKVALKIHGLVFVNMGSLISNHGDAGIFIKVVLVVLATVVDEQILFFVN